MDIKIKGFNLRGSVLLILAIALLAIAFSRLIIDSFQLPTQLRYPIGIIFVVIFWVIIQKKPEVLYWIVGLFICTIGGFLMFLSGREDIVEQLAWDPGLLGAGASIGGLGFTFLASILSKKSSNKLGDQNTIQELRANVVTDKTMGYAFLAIAILGLAKLAKDYLEKKDSRK